MLGQALGDLSMKWPHRALPWMFRGFRAYLLVSAGWVALGLAEWTLAATVGSASFVRLPLHSWCGRRASTARCSAPAPWASSGASTTAPHDRTLRPEAARDRVRRARPRSGASVRRGRRDARVGRPARERRERRDDEPQGLYVGAIWPSFSTGLSPSRHGRICFKQLAPGSYRLRNVRYGDVSGEPFWRPLNAQGLSAAIVDLPKTALDEEIRGCHVVDWGTHDGDPRGLRTAPAARRREILGRFPPGPIGPSCDHPRHSVPEVRAFRDALVERARTRAEMVEVLIDERIRPRPLRFHGVALRRPPDVAPP